ncbi:MAG: hypothetical protein IT553_03225 [Sphingomonadaceae bacterium]|nr:hypothetical protein [Sphingomonadaceae bacterium]
MAEPKKRAPDMRRSATTSATEVATKSATGTGAKSRAKAAPVQLANARAQNGARQVRRGGNRLPPETLDAFFEALTETSNTRLSAETAGISIATVKQRRRNDPEFARRFDMAKHEGREDLEMRALAQGRFGVRQVEEVKRHKDGHVRTVIRDHALATLRGLDAIHHAAARRGAEALAAQHADQSAQSDAQIVAGLAAAFAALLRERLGGADGR